MSRERWRISGLKLRLNEAEQEWPHLRRKVAAAMGLAEDKLLELSIYKKSLDAREAGEPVFVYTVDIICRKAPGGRVKGRGLKIEAKGRTTEFERQITEAGGEKIECEASLDKDGLIEFNCSQVVREGQPAPVAGCDTQAGQATLAAPLAELNCSQAVREGRTAPVAGCDTQAGRAVSSASLAELNCSQLVREGRPAPVAGCDTQAGQAALAAPLAELNCSQLVREGRTAPVAGCDTRVRLAALAAPPVVVGAGPAGLFAALCLAEAGYKPLLVEQGQPVEQRVRDVELFWKHGCLKEESNVQFGEGGAGTFSDGKLTFRGKDALSRQVLQTLVHLGAPPHILYWHKPHLGSDKLRELLPLLRRRIQAAGGRVMFNTRVSGLRLSPLDGRRALSALLLKGAYSGEVEASAVILAPGNGARSTFYMLDSCGAALAAKPFAVGLRIEHSQCLIDKAQYGTYAGHAALPAADYQLKYRSKDGRTFYSFCMCPGGHIVNAASELGGVVTNGISLAARLSGRANSAVVGEVAPGRDFADGPFEALAWQQELERAACRLSGAEHNLAVCMAEDFIRGCGAQRPPEDFAPLSYAWQPRELRSLLPEPIGEGLAQALCHWNRQIAGFAEQAVLAAVESRTSSPVRILRGADGQSVNIRGLYPAGEGAGYAGGILSSAVDGLRAAQALQQQYAAPKGDFPLSVIESLQAE